MYFCHYVPWTKILDDMNKSIEATLSGAMWLNTLTWQHFEGPIGFKESA